MWGLVWGSPICINPPHVHVSSQKGVGRNDHQSINDSATLKTLATQTVRISTPFHSKDERQEYDKKRV